MKSFYVTLPSNIASPEIFAKNTIGNYITKLAQKIDLKGKWMVGISSISYTKSWYNVTSDVQIRMRNILEDKELKPKFGQGIVRKGHYNVKLLLEELNRRVCEYETTEPAKIQIDEATRKVSFKGTLWKNSRMYPTIEGDLGNMLGFRHQNATLKTLENKLHPRHLVFYSFNLERGFLNKNDVTPDDTFRMTRIIRSGRQITGSDPLDISGGFHSLFVYCDIIEPNFVGDSNVRLLQLVEIPTEKAFGEQVSITYENPEYKPLLKYNFDTIEIDIKDDANETVPFAFGRVIITLHFIEVL